MIFMVLLSNLVVKNIQALCIQVFEPVITSPVFKDFEEVKLGE